MLKSGQPQSQDDDIYDGVYVGIVTNNKDPENLGKIKVLFPWMDATTESHWARLATLYAGKDRGSYFVPEVGDEVLVVFEHGDMNRPYVVGSLWNGKDPLPEPGHPDGEDNHKVVETRSGHKLTFDDTAGAEFITLVDSSMNNRMVIDVAGDSITLLAATGDIHIKAPAGSVNFTSKTMAVSVQKTKQHTSGVKHDITVKQGNYEATTDKAKTLTVGAKTSRAAQSMAITASSQLSSTGGSATVSVTKGGAMIQSGPVTQTVGQASITTKASFDVAPSKVWTVGSLNLKSAATLSVDASVVTVMSGLLNIEAKSGQLSLLGSPIIHLGGLINVKGDQVAFKPGG
ncbi:MAG: phage baseplate assembly protein V [bacterium]